MTDHAALVDDYAAFARASGHAKTTVYSRTTIVTKALRELACDPLTVTSAQLVGWLANPNWSVNTRAQYVSTLRSFFGWLVEYDHRTDNPATRLRRPRVPIGVPRPATKAELADALARSEDHMRLALTLAAYAGCRAADIASLRREDITEDTIRIRKGKGGKDAALPCHPSVWTLVKDLPPGPLLVDHLGRPATPRWVSNRVARWFDNNGLPALTAHSLRHSFATNLMTAGADLRTVQELMRHSSLTATQVYTQVSDERKARAVAALVAA